MIKYGTQEQWLEFSQLVCRDCPHIDHCDNTEQDCNALGYIIGAFQTIEQYKTFMEGRA